MYNYNRLIPSAGPYEFCRSQEHKVESLIRRLKFPVEDILRAVQEVGFDKEEVEEYIRDRYNRS